ncbi:MAG: VWA domain-containing protein [Acidobacteria bacterium]|jgi:Ca-activated chloride channel family protein|nr:VWA domain-containing protein [Acidobacteriota bacterium]
MRLKKSASFFCLLFVCLLTAVFANAQGVIIPIPCDFRPCRPIPRPRPIPIPNALPVKSIELDTKINGQVATTHVEQVFRNDTPYTLEGTYFFPIPETASIVEFAIWENGKKLVGEVRSREEARRIYDEVVRRQKDPGLLEYAGKDLFQASIFPIPPNSDKKLELTYSQVLKAESGTVAYRYPLGTGRNLWANPRPIPVPMMREDERTPVRNNQKFGTVSGKIEIVGKEALRNVYSPSHQIDLKRKGETAASVSFETSGNDNDFQLFYGLSSGDFGMSLLTYRETNKDGYFLLMLSPKDDIAEKELVNKDIVFVLDTSGSMAEEGKMEKARSALLFGIKTLRDGDRFNVINFAGEEHLMESGLIAANGSGKKRGEDFVGKLAPTGGTNINDSLIAALKQFSSSPRPKMLVFMTDGNPTVGESNAEKIIANVKNAKTEDIRLFTFGVGYDVNTQLLDKIASENSGASDYVAPKEDIEIKVSNFFTKVSAPVLSDLQIDFGGVETDYIYPRKLTDLFKGAQITLIGRYKNDNDLQNTVIRLSGKSGTENRTFTYQNLDFPLRTEENNFLPRLWATRRVGWLLEQIRANGETKELRDEVAELGTRYGIVTPYTSFLAADGSFESVRREVSGLYRINQDAAKSVKEKSGRAAVELSVQQNTQQSNATLAPSNKSVFVANSMNNQFVGTKNFYNQNGVWQDAEFKPETRLSEVNVKFGSDEFYALLNRERELAQFFALGEQVIVVWKGKVYRVTN